MNLYQVIVSNVGTVYDGNDAKEAESTYEHYRDNSKAAIGREAGEDVTMMYKGDPCAEYVGALTDARNNADTEGCNDSNCPACKIRRALAAELIKRVTHKDGELGYLIDAFIGRLNKIKEIEVTEEQKEPLYEALIQVITSHTNGG